MSGCGSSGGTCTARVADVKTIRTIEQDCFASVASFEVMKMAAGSVCERAVSLGMAQPILAAAGCGNNGGDAIFAAKLLRSRGVDVKIWLPLGEPSIDTDAHKAYTSARDEVEIISEPNMQSFGSVIDGLFGIGLNRPLEGQAAAAIRQTNASGLPILSIDVPSGIDADTGKLMGVAARASETITFFTHKIGLLCGDGKEHSGSVSIDALGFAEKVSQKGGLCIDGLTAPSQLVRAGDAHKGSCGSLALVGGADGMAGALALASRAAVAHGSGKVFAIPFAREAQAYDPYMPEVMWRRELPENVDAVVFGMGAGISQDSAAMLAKLLECELPLVLDADALNLLSEHQDLREKAALRSGAKVLTPHPAEAARLLAMDTCDVLSDRLAAARKIAERMDCVAVLKGSGTIIAKPSGEWGMIASGNPGLAQAGSGDLLSGIVGALFAQGCEAWDAAASGAWLHGAGADMVRDERGGVIGMPLQRVCEASSKILSRLAR